MKTFCGRLTCLLQGEIAFAFNIEQLKIEWRKCGCIRYYRIEKFYLIGDVLVVEIVAVYGHENGTER